MEKGRRRWQERLAGALELPEDMAGDFPRLTFLGRRQCVIENHRGVVEYGSGRIRVNTARGEVVVTGTGLGISLIWREEIVIVGRIERVEFLEP